jgi:hypothetical protein
MNAERKDKLFFPLYIIYYAKKMANACTVFFFCLSLSMTKEDYRISTKNTNTYDRRFL